MRQRTFFVFFSYLNMWLLNVFLLLSISCLGNGEDECPEHVLQVCAEHITLLMTPGFEFPKCDSEMESFCQNVTQFAECAINYKENCPDMGGPPLEFMKSLLSASNTFCKKDSAWFKGVVKYGSCYDNFVPGYNDFSDKCSPDLENRFHNAFSNVPDEPGLDRCFCDIRVATCIIDNMPKICGKMATELGLHFLNAVGFWTAFCLDNKEKAMQMMKDMEITFDSETSQKEFVAQFEDLSASYGPNKDLCLRNYKDVCRDPGHFIEDFPENAEKLAARCTEHIKYKECLIDYQKSCGEEIWGMEFSVQADLDTLNTFCNENPALFHALADNGKCFNKLYQNFEEETESRLYECQEEMRNRDPEKFEEEYRQRYPDDWDRRWCFSELEIMKCLSEAVSKDCGENAKELMLQALRHNRMKYTSCKDYPEEAENYMQAMNFNLNPRGPFQDFVNSLENEA